MSKSKASYLIIALLILVFVVASAFLKIAFSGDDVKISISENKNEFRISASFPKAKSGEVHNYLLSQLNLGNLPDLKHLEVKKYRTPDDLMFLSIKSRDGYVKMSLNKDANSSDAYRKMKKVGEGLKEVLAH